MPEIKLIKDKYHFGSKIVQGKTEHVLKAAIFATLNNTKCNFVQLTMNSQGR